MYTFAAWVFEAHFGSPPVLMPGQERVKCGNVPYHDDQYSDRVTNLLENCLTRDPTQRLSAAEVSIHPCFTKSLVVRRLPPGCEPAAACAALVSVSVCYAAAAAQARTRTHVLRACSWPPLGSRVGHGQDSPRHRATMPLLLALARLSVALQADFQTSRVILETERKREALYECIQAMRVPDKRLRVTVMRTMLVDTTVEQVMNAPKERLGYRFDVKFHGEPGIDAGGLTWCVAKSGSRLGLVCRQRLRLMGSHVCACCVAVVRSVALAAPLCLSVQ